VAGGQETGRVSLVDLYWIGSQPLHQLHVSIDSWTVNNELERMEKEAVVA
jgi:hypothetical protein